MQTNQTSEMCIQDLEAVESCAWGDLYKATSPDLVQSCGIAVMRQGNAIVTGASSFDVLALNRAFGFGLGNNSVSSKFDTLLPALHESAAPRYFVQLNPVAIAHGAERLLEERGYAHYNNWVKLRRHVSPIDGVKSDLRIERVGPGYGGVFGQIVIECFGWPAVPPSWIGGLLRRDGCYRYLAFDGETPVATGAFFVHGETAWIDFAATLHLHRGRGAQSALLERRVRDTANLGCTRIVVETAEETPEKPAPSYRNMVRFGFQTAYVRPNYIFVK